MSGKTHEDAKAFLVKLVESMLVTPVPDPGCDQKAFIRMDCCEKHRMQRTAHEALVQEALLFQVETNARFGTKIWISKFLDQYGLVWPENSPLAVMMDGNDY